MVPYASFPYAEHALRLVEGADPNMRITKELTDKQVNWLIEAAIKMRQIVKDMESLEEIRGYIIYKQDEGSKSQLADGDKAVLNADELAMLQKFDGKTV
jgi:hypothetical protein